MLTGVGARFMDISRRLAEALADKASPDLPPPEAAKAARLHYVSDRAPGITRRRSGKGFAYRDPYGKPIRDADTLARIKAHRAAGLDGGVDLPRSAGPHPCHWARRAPGGNNTATTPWRDARDETKYEHMLAFGRALPRIRKCVEAVPSRQGAAGYRFAATMRGDDAGVIRLTPYLVRAAHQCEAAGRVP